MKSIIPKYILLKPEDFPRGGKHAALAILVSMIAGYVIWKLLLPITNNPDHPTREQVLQNKFIALETRLAETTNEEERVTLMQNFAWTHNVKFKEYEGTWFMIQGSRFGTTAWSRTHGYYNYKHLMRLQPPDRITGSWKGAWHTMYTNYTERIHLQLTQDMNTISGSGIDQKGQSATITGFIDNLDVELTLSNKYGQGTLTGRLKDKTISGTWHSDGQSGPVSITKISDGSGVK